MGLPARPFGEPVADRRRVDVEITRDVRLDEVEEFAELSGPMARETFADDLSRGDVNAVALVSSPPARGASARPGNGPGPGSGSFVQRTRDDPAAPNTDRRCRGHLEGLRAMRLQAEGPPDAMNGRGRVAARPRHRAKAPMGRVRRRLFQRQPDHFRDGVIADLTRRAGGKSTERGPPPHSGDATCPRCPRSPETNGDLLVLQPFRRRQDERRASPCDVLRRRDSASNSARSTQRRSITDGS